MSFMSFIIFKKKLQKTPNVSITKEHIQLKFFHIIFLILFLNKNKW